CAAVHDALQNRHRMSESVPEGYRGDREGESTHRREGEREREVWSGLSGKGVPCQTHSSHEKSSDPSPSTVPVPHTWQTHSMAGPDTWTVENIPLCRAIQKNRDDLPGTNMVYLDYIQRHYSEPGCENNLTVMMLRSTARLLISDYTEQRQADDARIFLQYQWTVIPALIVARSELSKPAPRGSLDPYLRALPILSGVAQHGGDAFPEEYRDPTHPSSKTPILRPWRHAQLYELNCRGALGEPVAEQMGHLYRQFTGGSLAGAGPQDRGPTEVAGMEVAVLAACLREGRVSEAAQVLGLESFPNDPALCRPLRGPVTQDMTTLITEGLNSAFDLDNAQLGVQASGDQPGPSLWRTTSAYTALLLRLRRRLTVTSSTPLPPSEHSYTLPPPPSRELLYKALKANPLVPEYLLLRARLPPSAIMRSLILLPHEATSNDLRRLEAAIYACAFGHLWGSNELAQAVGEHRMGLPYGEYMGALESVQGSMSFSLQYLEQAWRLYIRSELRLLPGRVVSTFLMKPPEESPFSPDHSRVAEELRAALDGRSSPSPAPLNPPLSLMESRSQIPSAMAFGQILSTGLTASYLRVSGLMMLLDGAHSNSPQQLDVNPLYYVVAYNLEGPLRQTIALFLTALTAATLRDPVAAQQYMERLPESSRHFYYPGGFPPSSDPIPPANDLVNNDSCHSLPYCALAAVAPSSMVSPCWAYARDDVASLQTLVQKTLPYRRLARHSCTAPLIVAARHDQSFALGLLLALGDPDMLEEVYYEIAVVAASVGSYNGLATILASEVVCPVPFVPPSGSDKEEKGASVLAILASSASLGTRLRELALSMPPPARLAVGSMVCASRVLLCHATQGGVQCFECQSRQSLTNTDSHTQCTFEHASARGCLTVLTDTWPDLLSLQWQVPPPDQAMFSPPLTPTTSGYKGAEGEREREAKGEGASGEGEREEPALDKCLREEEEREREECLNVEDALYDPLGELLVERPTFPIGSTLLSIASMLASPAFPDVVELIDRLPGGTDFDERTVLKKTSSKTSSKASKKSKAGKKGRGRDRSRGGSSKAASQQVSLHDDRDDLINSMDYAGLTPLHYAVRALI
ncbi:hypothetical protein KIPB_005802, partial [Kipferlia bialata]